MAQLVPFPFDTPGIAGLNLQASNTILGPEWATVMDNLIIDEEGRIGVRKGTTAVADNDTTNAIETVFTSIQSDGTKYVHAADAGGKVYNNATTATTMTDRSGTATLAGDGKYTYLNFNDKVVALHSDGTALVQATPTGDFVNITPSLHAVPGANHAYAGWGRIWIVTDTTLYWSNLLDETGWRTSGTATDAGFLVLNNVWPGGKDVGVALAEFNGNLVIYGEHSLVVFAGPTDPLGTGFAKVEAIEGTGCQSAPTVQNIGRDVIWVSNSGLKSLGRVIQEKSMPMNDALPQGRDYLLASVKAGGTAVRGAYAESEGLYLVVTPTETFAINVKSPMGGTQYRFTLWDNYSACASDGSGGLLVASGKKVYKYTGILEFNASNGTGGSVINPAYESGWLDFGNLDPALAPRLKILKRFSASIAGGGGATIAFRWTVDYSESFSSGAKVVPSSANTTAKYGIAQYGIDHYGADFDIRRLGTPASRQGRVVKIGLRVSGATDVWAINRMDLFAKIGKVRI